MIKIFDSFNKSSLLKLSLGIIIFSTLSFISIKKMQEGYTPKEGFVPNETTAIKIAEAVWLPIYGKEIYEHKPFKAKLQSGVWVVDGTLHTEKGGTPYVEIQKSDGKILKLYHTK